MSVTPRWHHRLVTTQERINRLTRRQHGLLTWAQALEAGLGPRQIEDRVRRGHWAAIRPGVYAVAGMPPSREQALLAVLLAVGSRTVVSHRSAARLWRLKGVDEPEHISVTVDLSRVVRLDGVVGHRSGTLFDEDLVVVRGVAVTSQARTLIDLSGSLSLGQLGRALFGAAFGWRRCVGVPAAWRPRQGGG
jgi:predicted transcriptional regulator of viral defense system